jgi:hypothetical protein
MKGPSRKETPQHPLTKLLTGLGLSVGSFFVPLRAEASNAKYLCALKSLHEAALKKEL